MGFGRVRLGFDELTPDELAFDCLGPLAPADDHGTPPHRDGPEPDARQP